MLLSLLTVASLNAKAEVLSGFLDLSNLYAKTNAGQYFIGVTVNTKNTAALQVTQKLSDRPDSDQPGTEPQVCLTEFLVNAGELTLILTDSKKDLSNTSMQAMELSSYYYDDTENCTPVANLLKTPLNFMPYFNFGSFKMNYPAPADYNEMYTAISLFPFGYNVVLNISKDTDKTYVVDNLKTQLSMQLKRGNREAMSYYTYAQSDAQYGLTTLALGQGFIELK